MDQLLPESLNRRVGGGGSGGRGCDCFLQRLQVSDTKLLLHFFKNLFTGCGGLVVRVELGENLKPAGRDHVPREIVSCLKNVSKTPEAGVEKSENRTFISPGLG